MRFDVLKVILFIFLRKCFLLRFGAALLPHLCLELEGFRLSQRLGIVVDHFARVLEVGHLSRFELR